jgi:hypothetical protein
MANSYKEMMTRKKQRRGGEKQSCRKTEDARKRRGKGEGEEEDEEDVNVINYGTIFV